MSARSGEWHLLGRGRDPVPGSPEEAERLATGFESTAADIARLAGQLRRLSDLGDWKGEAAEEFGAGAEDLADELRRAERRYADLAAAVRGWVQPLTTARNESQAALTDAVTADEARRRHSQDLLAGVAEPTPAQLTAQQQQQTAHAAAATRLREAQTRLDEALRALDTAAARTADQIRAAAEHGGDSWWDDVKGTVRDHAGVLSAIADVLSWVAMALAAVTLVVVLIATAPAWLFAAGVIASVTLLGLHAALVLSESGEASWTDVGLDVLGVATAGIGGTLARGVSKAVPALRGQVGALLSSNARAAQEAAEAGVANFGRASNASNIPDVTNNLRRWADRYLTDAATRVTDAGADAAARLEAGVVTHAPWLNRVRALDKDLAEDLLELQRLGQQPIDAELRVGLEALTSQGRWAAGLAWTNLGGQVADSGDQIADSLGGPDALLWKDDVDDAVWRLTHR